MIKKEKINPKKNEKPLSHCFSFSVVMEGIEPPTQGFSVLCSTD